MQTYSKILELVTIKEEQELWKEETERLLGSLYKTDAGGWEEVLSSGIRRKTAEAVRAGLGEWPGKREDWLEGFKQALDQLKTVRLTIGFEPSEKTVGKISAWLKENVGEGVVLELVYDSSLIGGVVVIFEGHWADYSLAKKIRKLISEPEKA